MSKKGTPSAPPAPDPAETAKAQGAMNKETAIAQANMNRINQITPFGNLTYQQIGTNSDGTPQFQATQTLSPAEQQKLNISNQASVTMGNVANDQLGRLQTSLSQPFEVPNNPAQVTNIDTNTGNLERQRVEEAIMSRLNPQFERDRAGLESRLASQGIAMGSEAYNRGMDEFRRAQNDARMQAVLSGGQEQTRMFNMASANAALQNAGRQQAIQEAAMRRNQPLNEITALLSGTQIQNPQFVNSPQVSVAAPDYMGAVNTKYAGDMQNYNAQLQRSNAGMGGLFGLGGSILSMGMNPTGGLFGYKMWG